MANENQEKWIRRGLVYGANYGARLLGNLGKDLTFTYIHTYKGDNNPDTNLKDNFEYGLGHPFTAMGFAAWDAAFDTVPYLKSADWAKTANVLTKAGGAVYFGFLTVKNLVDFALGHYNDAAQFPFNLSMTATLGKDLTELLK
jgi:hypothetical protein